MKVNLTVNLSSDKIIVSSSLGHEASMSPRLHYSAIHHYCNAVSISYSAETMCHHNAGTTNSSFLQCFLHCLLTLSIQRRRSFIKK